MNAIFTLGRIIATPSAIAALGVSDDTIPPTSPAINLEIVSDIDAHNRAENQLSPGLGFGCLHNFGFARFLELAHLRIDLQ
jgi:hypothetical protein